jgi:RNA polymerase sigma-70 factor (ECF subfamily)
MQVLRNTFLTQRRAAARRPQSSHTTIDDIEPADPRSSYRPEHALAAQEVFRVIAALPENYRLALVAVDVIGLSYREAGEALGTREATIATRVFRGREQVARELTEQAPAKQPVDVAAKDLVRERGRTTPREAPGPHGSLV